MTAASTKSSSRYGFLITDSDINLAPGVTNYYLGRPWPQFVPDSGPSVLVRDTDIPKTPTSAWKDWSDTFTWKERARYAEYANTGAGADNSGTNANRPQLTDRVAKEYTAARYLMGRDNWDPTGTLAQEDFTPPAAPTDVTATVDGTDVDLSWTAPADGDVVGYRVYRSTSSGVTATAGELIASDVTSTSYGDTSAAFGTTYHYAVVAVDAAGQASPLSGEADASALPVGTDVVVAADGSGDYTTVSAAVTAATAGTSADPYVIAVRPGVYRETVTLKNKSYVQILGTSDDASDTTIVYN
ncbi:pectinesterase family protein [Streptomyces sp. NPDC002143]